MAFVLALFDPNENFVATLVGLLPKENWDFAGTVSLAVAPFVTSLD